MARQDRLRVVSYESPGGKKFTWNFTNVSRSFEQKGGEFVFPDVDGSYIQQKGVSGQKLPMLCLFNGDDCDLQADAFMTALAEKGTGVLDHPRYGRLNVVPFGEITQRDDLVDNDNESAVEVTFYVTINIIYPISSKDVKTAARTSLDALSETASRSFAGKIIANTAAEITSLRTVFNTVTNTVSAALKPIYSAQSSINTEMLALVDSMNDSVTALAGDPYLFAKQCMQMMSLPANASGQLKSRIDAYISTLTTINAEAPNTTNLNVKKNNIATKHMVLLAGMYGVGLTTLSSANVKREDAAAVLDQISYINLALQYVFDTDNDSVGVVDDGTDISAYTTAMTNVMDSILQIMMDLPQQRAIILDRNRTIIDLAAEIYGQIDEKLDELIYQNNIIGLELFELKRGRKIVYLV